MEKSTTWLKEMALLDIETLSVPYPTACDESPTTQTPEVQQRQVQQPAEVSHHLCSHTCAVHQATAGRHACHASRRRFLDMVMVALVVPLTEAPVLAVIDALAAREQFALGAVGQLP
jgi:hypothetical protein